MEGSKMEKMTVVIDAAPCVKCDQQNNFLDIGLKKYLADLEAQGICIAVLPKQKEWESEVSRTVNRKYHLPTDEEWPKVKAAKIVNETYVHASPAEMRRLKNMEAAKAAIKKSESPKKKGKKEETEPQEVAA
jgi:hypothetical protein